MFLLLAAVSMVSLSSCSKDDEEDSDDGYVENSGNDGSGNDSSDSDWIETSATKIQTTKDKEFIAVDYGYSCYKYTNLTGHMALYRHKDPSSIIAVSAKRNTYTSFAGIYVGSKSYVAVDYKPNYNLYFFFD